MTEDELRRMVQEHCGEQAFSPVAPPEFCQRHEIPEPSSLAIAMTALILMLLRRVGAR